MIIIILFLAIIIVIIKQQNNITKTINTNITPNFKTPNLKTILEEGLYTKTPKSDRVNMPIVSVPDLISAPAYLKRTFKKKVQPWNFFFDKIEKEEEKEEEISINIKTNQEHTYYNPKIIDGIKNRLSKQTGIDKNYINIDVKKGSSILIITIKKPKAFTKAIIENITDTPKKIKKHILCSDFSCEKPEDEDIKTASVLNFSINDTYKKDSVTDCKTQNQDFVEACHIKNRIISPIMSPNYVPKPVPYTITPSSPNMVPNRTPAWTPRPIYSSTPISVPVPGPVPNRVPSIMSPIMSPNYVPKPVPYTITPSSPNMVPNRTPKWTPRPIYSSTPISVPVPGPVPNRVRDISGVYVNEDSGAIIHIKYTTDKMEVKINNTKYTGRFSNDKLEILNTQLPKFTINNNNLTGTKSNGDIITWTFLYKNMIRGLGDVHFSKTATEYKNDLGDSFSVPINGYCDGIDDLVLISTEEECRKVAEELGTLERSFAADWWPPDHHRCIAAYNTGATSEDGTIMAIWWNTYNPKTNPRTIDQITYNSVEVCRKRNLQNL